MTLSEQIKDARKVANSFKEGTQEFIDACLNVKRLVEIQSAQIDTSPMNVILLPSTECQRNYRAIPA